MSYCTKFFLKNDTLQNTKKTLECSTKWQLLAKLLSLSHAWCEARGSFLWSYALSNNTTQNHSFAMLDALMYFIIRNPMFTQLHIIFTLKISLPSFWHTIKHLQHERLYDKLNLDLINFTRRQARLVVPDKGSHYDAKWIFYFPKLSSE